MIKEEKKLRDESSAFSGGAALHTIVRACFGGWLFVDAATLCPGAESPLQESLFPMCCEQLPSTAPHFLPGHIQGSPPALANSFPAQYCSCTHKEQPELKSSKCLNFDLLVRSQRMIITNLISPNKLISLILTLRTRKVRHRQYKFFCLIHPVQQVQKEI